MDKKGENKLVKNKATRQMKIMDLPNLIVISFKEWLAKDPFKLSAVVAYYAILSLPALLILLLDLVGAVWGRKIVQGELTQEISSTLGSDTAKYLQEIIAAQGETSTSLVATVIGIGTLLYGATGVFYQLQNAMDTIWKTQPKYSDNLFATLIGRLKSFGFILIFGFLLLISFVLTTVLSTFSKRLDSFLPEGVIEAAYLIDVLVSLSFVYVLFASMFKYLPSTPVPWKAVRSGAALTTILFVIGKYVLAVYFAQTEPGSTYGAAGSIILVMLWVSYTSLILFFGAQFTKVFSDKYIV